MMVTKFSWQRKPTSDANNYQISPFIDCEIGLRLDRDELKVLNELINAQTHTNGGCSITIRDAEKFRKNLIMILEADVNSAMQDRIDKMVMYNVLEGDKIK
jgi:hypothetical protein